MKIKIQITVESNKGQPEVVQEVAHLDHGILDIPEEPIFGGEGEKKFWIFSKSGKEVGLKYS